ncbi:hypothetical protein JCM8097_007960 [Rhodosporidiobolus ruineniae]
MEDSLTPLLNALQAALVPPTTAAAALPSAADLAFERTLSRRTASKLDTEALRILTLADRVLNWATPQPNNPNDRHLDQDLVREGIYNSAITRIEHLLEHADDNIDKHRHTGKHRTASGPGALGAKTADEMNKREHDKQLKGRLPARLLHDASLVKPQTRFLPRTVVPLPPLDDAATEVPLWKPVLREKLNALDQGSDDGASWLKVETYEPSSSLSQTTGTVPPPYARYAHPYAAELAALSPPSAFFDKPDTPKPHPKDSFDKVPFEWVDSEEALERMVEELRAVGAEWSKELAIDLEHHDFRTWAGMTCLIQLSTRKKDYVIDALEPSVRDNLDGLNEFFTDPEWIKVLHGASSDIVWLQRDFGLYVVGLFDTYHATKVLGFNQHSLASLLDMYTDFEPDKRYQLADWRIRPLPKEMLHYARSDTHYLLSIYDHLRLALHAKAASSPDVPSPTALLSDVFTASKSVSGITFSLPPFDAATGHFDSGFLLPLSKHGQLKAYSTALAVPTLPIKTGWGPGEAKLEVLRAVVRWREQTARAEDESPRYVLTLGGVAQLAELGGLGRVREAREVMQVLGGARGGVSEVVRRRKEELAAVIVAAYEGAVGKTGEGEGEDVDMAATSGAAVQPVQIGLPAEEPSVRPASASLWGDVAEEPVASTSAAQVVLVQSAAGSSFYGSSASFPSSSSSSGPSSAVTARASSFFGTTTSRPPTSTGKKGKQPASSPLASPFDGKAAVARVHASLVLGGGLAASLQAHVIPSVASPAEVEVAAAEVEEELPQPEALSADHTYVPLSGRIPKPERTSTLAATGGAAAPEYAPPKKKDSDVIVVSSVKDAQKKRKRAAAAVEKEDKEGEEQAGEEGDEGATPPKKPKTKSKSKKPTRAELAASIIPHDYSASPSILDAPSSASGSKPLIAGAARRAEDKKARKAEARAEAVKKSASKGLDTSAFGRAPRVNNAPKKGAVSKIFGK